jgi:hypothetical protein
MLLWLLMLLTAPASAQLFVGSDPKIDTLVLHDAGPAEMDQRRILILPFESDQTLEPAPPDFAPHLKDALGAWLAAAEATVPFQPTTAGVAAARAAGFDFLVRGRTELYYQGGRQALKIRIRAELLDLTRRPAEVVWRGRKTAAWSRRKPPEDCLLYLASDFVADWLWEKH